MVGCGSAVLFAKQCGAKLVIVKREPTEQDP